MALWTAFMLGFAGSLHCAGMCGPLVLALPAAGGNEFAHFAGKLAYNLGRVFTYGLLGIAFGLLGQMLGMAGLQRWVAIGAGTTILLSLFAWPLRHVTPLVTRPVARLKAGLGTLLRRRSVSAQFLFGGLNGLLPCGLVYVACAAATATGSLFAGLEYMLVFGLGTVPMMLGLGLAGRFLHRGLQLRFQRLVPASLAVMGALLILRGLGLGIPYLSPDLSPTAPPGHSCCPPTGDALGMP